MNLQSKVAGLAPIELDWHARACFSIFALRRGSKTPIVHWLKDFLAANPPTPLSLVLAQLIMMLEETDPHFKLELKHHRAGNPNDKKAAEWERKFLGDMAILRYADLLQRGVPEYGLTGRVAAEIGDLFHVVMDQMSIPTKLGQRAKHRQRGNTKTEKERRSEVEQCIQDYIRRALQERKTAGGAR